MHLQMLVVLESKYAWQYQIRWLILYILSQKNYASSLLLSLTCDSIKTLTRTGVGPFEIGVKICSLRSKGGFNLWGVVVVVVTVKGAIGDRWSNSTVSSEQTDAVAKEKEKYL